MRGRRRWTERWDPEDERFWRATGRRAARRNLLCSILAHHVGFLVWLLWSVVVVALPGAGFDFSVEQRFWLVALPNLVGATVRLPYTVAVPRFGGRDWTVASTLILLLPAGLLAVVTSDPATPYWVFLVAAATAGLGGGCFASSMANISFFYPERAKGFALGVNAAGGNLGVSMAQLAVPPVIAAGLAGPGGVAAAGWLSMPLVLLAAACAWRFMDNLAIARSSLADQLVVLRSAHTWIMSLLYVGTFGSFIGYAAALPLLITTQFPGVVAARWAFLGALAGSLARPLGGWLADRLGGARVTLASFAAMAAGAALALWSLGARSFGGFLASFLLLFVASGAGNGSTYRMIPAVFRVRAVRLHGRGSATAQALAIGRREAAAAIGIAAAVGAYGGFAIPLALGSGIGRTGDATVALVLFLAFYLLCMAVTWWWYLRRRLLAIRRPSLASAEV